MKNITTMSIKVTEEINPKKLLTFLRTQIELQSLLITDTSYFYYSFLPQSLQYEVIVFTQKKDFFSSLFIYLFQLCKEELCTLFITADFFCIYEKRKLIALKKVSNVTQTDILSYVEQTYQVTPTNTVDLRDEDMRGLVESCNEKCKKGIEKNIYKVIPDNSFQYFIFYTLCASVVFMYLILDNYHSKTLQNAIPTVSKQYDKNFYLYKKHQKNSSVKNLLDFTSYLDKNKIEYKTIEFDKGIFKISLAGEDKKILLKSLEYTLKKVVLESIQFNENTKFYDMDVVLYDKK